jgi:Fur family ferric uptake transcriptional regulator
MRVIVACENLRVTIHPPTRVHKPLSMERSTRQRAAIRAVIDTAGRPLSPQEVLEAAQAEVPAMGMATVYRNLKLLVDADEVIVVSLPAESPRYEPAHREHEHHHHFQCTNCKRVFDVHACPGDMARLAPKGFTVEHHELTLYGRCADCRLPQQKPKSAARQRA